MFWRDRERDNRDHNGGPPVGQIRVLVVGDSGVGKTSLVHLIVNGSAVARPPPTIGCMVSLKHITYRSSASSSNGFEQDVERDFFVELWDVSGHERYKDCRSLFYSQINGVIFVYDLSQRRTKSGLQKWAAEVAANGTFSAPLASGGPYGLPVPYIVISNKADIGEKDERGSSGNLVDFARQWVEKQGLLSSGEELPLTASFPGNSALVSAVKEARFDKEALTKFFHLLIKRRYFADEVPSPSPWSLTSQRTSQHFTVNLGDDDVLLHPSARLRSNLYNHNAHPPLPAQRNLPPPPTLYPQQPVTNLENYSYPRIYQNISSEFSYPKSKRTDIDV